MILWEPIRPDFGPWGQHPGSNTKWPQNWVHSIVNIKSIFTLNQTIDPLCVQIYPIQRNLESQGPIPTQSNLKIMSKINLTISRGVVWMSTVSMREQLESSALQMSFRAKAYPNRPDSGPWGSIPTWYDPDFLVYFCIKFLPFWEVLFEWAQFPWGSSLKARPHRCPSGPEPGWFSESWPSLTRFWTLRPRSNRNQHDQKIRFIQVVKVSFGIWTQILRPNRP